MRITLRALAIVMALSAGAAAARADVWDAGTDNDNSSSSENELVNGLDQVHDMAAQQGGTVEDVDWYPFRVANNHSYEILLDGLTGGIGSVLNGSPRFDVLGSDASTVLYFGLPVTSLGIARRIIIGGSGPEAEFTFYVRVSGPDCGLSCVNTDRYHIHFRETTALVPRFNNSASQVSFLVLQNSTSADVFANVAAYDATGTLLTIFPVSLSPNQVMVVNLSTVDGSSLAGRSGGLKIENEAPYGTLAGKVVAVEPATGFTFDTPLVYKPPEE